ncbi:Protein-associating with the carboxyl-terminal domain of ezrin, partial [Geodia barretti]
MLEAMGNEVSATEGESEEKEEEDEWTSREEDEVSGGLWSLSHEVEDGQQVCVLTCAATGSSQAQLCQSGAEHLRLLRHPSIVKFLSYDPSLSPLVMVTEAVLPVWGVVSGMCEEGMVTGWRDIAKGLAFLHDKAKLSHNSLCCECVFVCANTSHWKIGGFEAAAHHSKINHTVRLQTPLIVHSSTVSLSLQFIETIAA